MGQLADLDDSMPGSMLWHSSLQRIYLFSMGYFETSEGFNDESDLKPENPNDSNDSGDEAK